MKIYVESGQEKEKEIIKNQYLCLEKPKRRVIKTIDKFRNSFNFNWDAEDDTSKDHNPLYKYKMKENLLFGRGTKAGFDLTEQKNKLIDYSSLIDKAGKQQKMELERNQSQSEDDDNEMSSITQRLHNPQKKADPMELGSEKNYKNKSFEQMQERDWRIFREDHDIIIKGGRVPPPLRTWD